MLISTLKTIENPNEEQIELLRAPLKMFNEASVGKYRRREFAIYAYEAGNRLIGGMYGWLHWDWLYIDIAWVDEAHRHKGVGKQLLSECERFAIDRCIYNSRLNTGSFQAPDFYENNGYEVFAQLDIVAPDGSAQVDYFMKKKLS